MFQRVLDPGSERSLVRSFLPSVFAPEFDGIELQHAYRALQFLAEVGPELEARLTRVMTVKLFADASPVLFDTSSTYFEGRRARRARVVRLFPRQARRSAASEPGAPHQSRRTAARALAVLRQAIGREEHGRGVAGVP